MSYSIELQNIDCNCNNCIFMVRDFDKFNYWESYNRQLQLKDFERKKQKAIDDANNHPDIKAKEGALRKANKMTFQFDKEGQISYGNCSKFNKPVSFIPEVCQIETQECFENRRK